HLAPESPVVLLGYVRSLLHRRLSSGGGRPEGDRPPRVRAFRQLIRPVLEQAAQRCLNQIEAGVNRPWADYHLGELRLLLASADEGLEAYTRGLLRDGSASALDSAVAGLDALRAVQNDLPGYQWARYLLLVGQAVRRWRDGGGDRVVLPSELKGITGRAPL